ncbi:acyl-CoA dehydrogenase family protein [Kyrpidia tusciae]|uniref:Acyl-CoA dehydrogenase domain protein n=1 Tax=Kyrpidia tusciae (strain DSM 2912 / NBRC 15312 / T2) TaxID=562970 RepID=D5WXV4_KYRT2|nr:acyl-CoA dehydrogenase family protein [Kyrpidia tusciae]ADG06013.1 acyl-CoA dehydrogenase domain protein [Kyrpidia tusciae DSM 2912]
MSGDVRRMVADTARRIFQGQCTPELLAAADNHQFPTKLWSLLESNAFTKIDEEGLNTGDALVLLEIAGYYAVPGPLASSLAASKMMVDMGVPIPSGVVTCAIQPGGAIELTHEGERAVVSGTWVNVPWGRASDTVLAVFQTLGGWFAAVLNSRNVSWEKGQNLGGEPRDTLQASHVSPSFVQEISEQQSSTLRALLALSRVALTVGALERMLNMTVEYAQQRAQFGRSIGKFQAVQHQIAEMAAETAAVQALFNRAVYGVDQGEDMMRYASLAKIRIAEAIRVVTAGAHQVHGAIGFTQEYSLHYFSRRAWAYRHEYGNETWWSKILFAEIGNRDLWDFLTQPTRAE